MDYTILGNGAAGGGRQACTLDFQRGSIPLFSTKARGRMAKWESTCPISEH